MILTISPVLFIVYRSAYTCLSSVPMQRTWLSSMDDDDNYLDNCKPETPFSPDIDFTLTNKK